MISQIGQVPKFGCWYACSIGVLFQLTCRLYVGTFFRVAVELGTSVQHLET